MITGDVLASPASLSGFQGPVWATTPPPTCGASPSSQQRALLAMPRAGFCLYLLLPLAWGPAAVIPPSIPYPCAHAPWPVTKLPAEQPRRALSLWPQKEKLSAQASLKRHTSLNDLSLTRDEQEIEFLRLQVLEQQHVIDDLSLVRLCPGTVLGGAPSDTGSGTAWGL